MFIKPLCIIYIYIYICIHIMREREREMYNLLEALAEVPEVGGGALALFYNGSCVYIYIYICIYSMIHDT